MVFAEISNTKQLPSVQAPNLRCRRVKFPKKLVTYLLIIRDIEIIPVQIVSSFSMRNLIQV